MQKDRLDNHWLYPFTGKGLLGRWLVILPLALLIFSGSVYSAPKTILVLGDSLSAEYGLARGTGWVSLLEQRIHDKKMDFSVINASISGDTTSGGLARLPELLKKHHPSIVIIELGGNDGLRGLPVISAEKNMRTMIHLCQTDKVNVVLVGMQIPPNYGRNYTAQFSGMYQTIAKDMHIPLVPFLLQGVADKAELFQADRIHLVQTAHPQILENVWPYLNPLLKK